MSIKLMSNVFDASGLTPNQKLVLLALTDYAADDGTSIYPSIKTLASKTALSGSSIRNAIRELRNPTGLNLLTVVSHFTNRRPNRYAINISNLRALIPDTQSSRVSPPDTPGVTTRHPRVSPPDTDPSLDPSNDPPEPLRNQIEKYLKSVYNGQYHTINPAVLVDDVMGKITIGVETESTSLAAQVRTFLKGATRQRFKVSVILTPKANTLDELPPERRAELVLNQAYKTFVGGEYVEDNQTKAALRLMAGEGVTPEQLLAVCRTLKADKFWSDKISLKAVADHYSRNRSKYAAPVAEQTGFDAAHPHGHYGVDYTIVNGEIIPLKVKA